MTKAITCDCLLDFYERMIIASDRHVNLAFLPACIYHYGEKTIVSS